MKILVDNNSSESYKIKGDKCITDEDLLVKGIKFMLDNNILSVSEICEELDLSIVEVTEI